MRAAMTRAIIITAMISAAIIRTMIIGSAAMRSTMVIGSTRSTMIAMIAAGKEKVEAAKEKQKAMGSGAMITAAMINPKVVGAMGSVAMINPKVVWWQASQLEKMLPLPIIKGSGSHHPRASK